MYLNKLDQYLYVLLKITYKRSTMTINTYKLDRFKTGECLTRVHHDFCYWMIPTKLSMKKKFHGYWNQYKEGDVEKLFNITPCVVYKFKIHVCWRNILKVLFYGWGRYCLLTLSVDVVCCSIFPQLFGNSCKLFYL